jgi:hypothetical protein
MFLTMFGLFGCMGLVGWFVKRYREEEWGYTNDELR